MALATDMLWLLICSLRLSSLRHGYDNHVDDYASDDRNDSDCGDDGHSADDAELGDAGDDADARDDGAHARLGPPLKKLYNRLSKILIYHVI